MNKTKLVATIADKTGISKKDTERMLTAFVDTIGEELSKGEKIQLVGFGSFETKHREARQGRNPRTRETVQIPASTVPVFKAGKALKDKVGG